MRYLGGKARFGEEIARVVRSKRRFQHQLIREPFCGSCWVSQYLNMPLICSDIFLPIIQLHQAIQRGWIPPDHISEEEYSDLREEWKEGNSNPLIAFAGIAASWGAKWWGGYARGGNLGRQNYVYESKISLLDKHKNLKGVIFEHRNYKNLNPINEVIYCDPPYANTTGYNDQFNSKQFWEIMRQWSQNNIVLVSEYTAPSDFKIIWEVEHFAIKGSDSKITKEKVFQWNHQDCNLT